MKFNIVIYNFDKIIFQKMVQFDNQSLADAYANGVYQGLESAGEEPTGLTSKYVQD